MSEQMAEAHKTEITTPSDTEIRIERVFDAPRKLVWECYTDSDLLTEWLGPRRLTMTVDHYEMRTGGSYRYIHSDEDGNDYVFFGEVLEVEEPEYIVQTFNFVMEPQPPPSVDRADFEELGPDRTRVVSTSTFESKEYRDGMLQSGMETGVVEGYERMDELLERRK